MSATQTATNAAQAVGAATQAANAASAVADPLSGAANAFAGAQSAFSWSSYFQALAILFLIVACLWFGLWYLKRKGAISLLTRHGDLQLESRMALGPKKSLVVVRFLNKRVLLGVTDQQITMLTELSTDEDATGNADTDKSYSHDFKEHFQRESSKGSPES